MLVPRCIILVQEISVQFLIDIIFIRGYNILASLPTITEFTIYIKNLYILLKRTLHFVVHVILDDTLCRKCPVHMKVS